MQVFLGLGSNSADAKGSLRKAVEKINTLGTMQALSSLYKTEPVGFSEQPWFMNAVVSVDTTLSPEELFLAVKNIEKELGRTPTFKNGPREIDIDILLYGEEVINTPELTIPHARMHERAFVLMPLSEIAPEAVHPLLQKTATKLAHELNSSSGWEKLPAENAFPTLLQ